MFFIGMSLSITTLVREFFLIDKKFLAICLSQILSLPIITYLLTEYVFSTGSDFQLFMMILSLAPGAVTSTFFIKLINGNAYLSIKVSLIISLLSVVTIPLFLKTFLQIADSNISISLTRSIFQLVIVIAVPILAGSIISAYWRPPREKTIRLMIVLGIIVAYIVGIMEKYHLLEINYLILKLPVMAALIFIYVCIGMLVAYLFQLITMDAKTVVIETFMQNTPIVLLITNFLIPASPFIILVLTWTTMQIMMAVGIYYFYHYFSKKNQT
jgi:predicted Na+-dependent transporter